MKFIVILGAGLALSLTGCGSSDDEPPPPFANAAMQAPRTDSSASDTEEEGSDSGSDLNPAQYEGTSVEGISVSPAVDPSVPSGEQSADSETSSDNQSAEQASDESDGQ